MVTNSAGAGFTKSWIIKEADQKLFIQVAQKHGFAVELFAKPGEIIAMGGAESDIRPGSVGIRLSGPEWNPEIYYGFVHNYEKAKLDKKGNTKK